MIVLKIVGKIFLLPILLALFILGMVIAVIGGIYHLIHGFFWALMIIAVILFAVFKMWQNVIMGIAFMPASLMIVTMLDSLSSLIGGAVGRVIALLRS